MKEIYILSGENVAPAEVEEALTSHAAVAEVVVVGMPDPIWGESGCAFVKIAEPYRNVKNQEIQQMLIAHMRASLAPFRIPKRIVFLADIPRIGIDKVDRMQLKTVAVKMSDGVSLA